MATSAIDPAPARGLLRLPAFFKAFIANIKYERQFRSTEPVSHLNPNMQWSDVRNAAAIGVVLFTLRVALQFVLLDRVFAAYPKKLRKKLSENIYYTTYYVGAFAYFVFVLTPTIDWSTNLLSNTQNVIEDLLHPIKAPMNQAEHDYYALAMGFYVSASVFLIGFDSRRSDFLELLIHHFVTNGLVIVSYLYSYVRVGIVVLALHDFGDIFLYLAKVVHYLGYKGFDTAIFVVFTISFYITRLVMFSRICHTITVETLRSTVADSSFNEWLRYYETTLPIYIFFVIFLCTLLVLHSFWFCLMIKMIIREVFDGVKMSDAGDIRSDDEDDGDEVEEDSDVDTYEAEVAKKHL